MCRVKEMERVCRVIALALFEILMYVLVIRLQDGSEDPFRALQDRLENSSGVAVSFCCAQNSYLCP